MYVDENSNTANVIKTTFERFLDLHKKNEEYDKEIFDAFFNLTQYCKNYEGPLKHGKINDEKYRFYNEREWRFIPNKEMLGENKKAVLISEYVKDKEKFNKTIEDIYLKFNVENISYIIVNDSDEIPEILELINKSFEDSCTAKQLKVLGTKILTVNQIFNDF